jgi:hypothetical protein
MADGEPSALPKFPNLLTRDAYLAWFQSIKPPSCNRFHLLNNSLVMAKESSPSWAEVQIVGEICEDSSMDYQQGLDRLYDHGHMTFGSQPTRRFLRGLYIRLPSNTLELWVFDRAGQFLSESLDIHKEPDRFVSMMNSFLTLNDEELGMDTFIQHDVLGKYILLNKGKDTEEERIYLGSEPIHRRRGIMCRGTPACYRAKRPGSERRDLVVKFVWRLENTPPEETILATIKERKVFGVIQLWDHQEIDNVKRIRQSFGCKPTDESFENRIYSCVIVTPYGRPVWQCTSTRELLMTFRDAIKAHKSLYQDGRILHQDISPYNIIIPETGNDGDPNGVLIDLDGVMERDVGPRKEGEIIGTKSFMAIGVLKRELHTYRHDLESFLYSFLWVVICDLKKVLPETSKLQSWSQGSWDELAEKKIRDMEKRQFKAIIAEFPPRFQNLGELTERSYVRCYSRH